MKINVSAYTHKKTGCKALQVYTYNFQYLFLNHGQKSWKEICLNIVMCSLG